MRNVSWLCGWFLALSCGACDALSGGHACTLLACEDGASIAFEAASWPSGAYSVAIVADGQSSTCTVTLPFPGTDPGVQCDSARVRLETSGSALAPSEHALLGVRLLDTPARAEITVTRDGTPIATRSFDLAYVTTQPNGPDCEPTCTRANATLSF